MSETTTTFEFLLTQEEANLILNALAELPFKVSQSLIASLVKQYADQVPLSAAEITTAH
jgi:hypothetical protein